MSGPSTTPTERVSAAVPSGAPGVRIMDDWDGFGQRLTGERHSDLHRCAGRAARNCARPTSGSAIRPPSSSSSISRRWSGIARARGQRNSPGGGRAAPHLYACGGRAVGEDPQVLQVVGRGSRRSPMRPAPSCPSPREAIAARPPTARTDRRAARIEAANVAAEIEVAQAQTIVSELVLRATTIALRRARRLGDRSRASLDRLLAQRPHARLAQSAIYKDRIVGDYAVNGAPPPFQWRIGQS